MKISDEDIKNISSQSVYKRGIECFLDGRVHIKKREEKGISAVVDGEEDYGVRIDFKNGEISGTFCTCAYYQTMQANCKHIVATLKKRQTELMNLTVVDDENDRLAQNLCSEFYDNCFEKPRLNLKFILNILSTQDRKCSFYIDILCGFEEPKKINGVDNFLESYINGSDFKISKHIAINSSKYSLGENEKKIMGILCEAYENRLQDSAYTQRVSQILVAPSSVKRIMPLIFMCDFEIYHNSIKLNDTRMIEDNPDILIDINATDKEINLNVSQSGLSLFKDGSWYLYDNCFYHTNKEWRQWFMPIYNSLMTESRTQIDFCGDSRIDFATYVYPKIRNKQGVVTTGVDSIVIKETPVISVYLDSNNNNISAVIIVKYGAIDIRMPQKNINDEKIIIRDIKKESELMENFSRFSLENDIYTLSDNKDIYEFLNDKLPKIQQYANVYCSDSFNNLKKGKKLSIKTNVKYKKDIDLLEVGFETELMSDEILGILNSIKLREKFYRFNDGSFIDIDDESIKKFKLLDNIGFNEKEIRSKTKQLSKYHILYLDAVSKEGLIDTDKGVDELIKSINRIKPDIPSDIKAVLRDYQLRGVNWLKQLSELGFGGILADDMGLGKTLEVIAFVMSEKKDRPSLVVTPSALLYNWQNEIDKFAPYAKVKIVDGTKEEREFALKNIDGYDFIITSYPLIRRDIQLYQNIEFSFMFIDESQNIKNADTMSAKAVKKVKAWRKFALSGTPVENNLMELWSVFDFVMKGYLGSKKEFSKLYEFINKEEEKEELDDLRKKIKPFVLRRLKVDVLDELPEKIENTIYCDFTKDQKKMYEVFLKIAKNDVTSIINQKDFNMRILTILLRLRQICCHPSLFDENYEKESGKLNFLKELVESALCSGRRILIFSQFTSMLSIMRSEFKKMGIDYFFIDGKTSSKLRYDMAQRFNDGEKNLFLISLKAGGTGLNLVGADMVIHYDPWWNPAVTNQATDRAYRIGQKNSVQVIKLATKGSIEEQILKLQLSKMDLADSIIRKNDKTISGLSKEEILSLFE